MLKLKLQYFGHLMQTAASLEKSLMLVKIEGKRGRLSQKRKWLNGITNSMDMNLCKFWEMLRVREACPWGHKVLGLTWWLNNRKRVSGRHRYWAKGFYIFSCLFICPAKTSCEIS